MDRGQLLLARPLTEGGAAGTSTERYGTKHTPRIPSRSRSVGRGGPPPARVAAGAQHSTMPATRSTAPLPRATQHDCTRPGKTTGANCSRPQPPVASHGEAGGAPSGARAVESRRQAVAALRKEREAAQRKHTATQWNGRAGEDSQPAAPPEEGRAGAVVVRWLPAAGAAPRRLLVSAELLEKVAPPRAPPARAGTRRGSATGLKRAAKFVNDLLHRGALRGDWALRRGLDDGQHLRRCPLPLGARWGRRGDDAVSHRPGAGRCDSGHDGKVGRQRGRH